MLFCLGSLNKILYFCFTTYNMLLKVIDRLRHGYYNIIKVLIFVICVLLIVMMMPRIEQLHYHFIEGKPWPHERLVAPFDFPIQKPVDQLKREQEEIIESISPYFVFDDEITREGQDQLVLHFNQAWENSAESEKFSQDSNLEFLLDLYDSIQYIGIIKRHEVVDNKADDFVIQVIQNKYLSTRQLGQVFTLQTAYDAAVEKIMRTDNLNKQLLIGVLDKILIQNLIFDEKLTNYEIEQALSRMSTTYGLVQQGELIIDVGELVDEYKYHVINSLNSEYQLMAGSKVQQRATLIGQLILTSIVFFVLFFFIRYFRPETFDELRKLNLILILMLLVILPSLLVIDTIDSWLWFIPFGILPIIMITFFDTRLTLLVHLLTVVCVSFVVPNAFEFLFYQLIIGYIVVFSLRKHNKRIYFFRTSVYIFVTYVLIYIGFNLIRSGGLDALEISRFTAFAVSSLLTLLALPLIFLLERLFGMITDLTLLELSNTNSPLLRELALIAPGTFQHSIQVANLSEEALFEIDGDTLLARTGALYHDIGKMDNPTYFIENQHGGYNPHDDISFIESARIIIEHVTLGIEKARKAGLPEQIIDFIRTHHGNRRVEYFYLMEKMQNPGLELDERDFSYRGPIPFSKETAVVMMADSVEAASRSVKNPTEQKLSDLVENIIGKQLESKQFVNSNITLKEVDLVKKILKKKLMDIYHVRIAYPE